MMALRMLCYAAALTACGGRGVSLDPPSEVTPHRAALAVLTVSNATPDSLLILFRTALPPLQEVGVGAVPAHEQRRMAPVPAGEPIILVARRGDGAEYELPARSFAFDAGWTWVIPREAVFSMPEPRK